MSDPILLALDFGGTKLSAATVNTGAREWSALKRVMTPPNKDAHYDTATMFDLARQLLDGRTPAGIGVSFGGPVDARRGRVILSHHVPGWEDAPLREQLQEAFRAPASIDNDANVAALGEYHFGAGVVGGRRVSSLLYVTVSTGVGGGWVLDGAIYGGADAMAGEIGHTIVDPQGPVCICGRRGCVEVMACGPAIAREARARLMVEPRAGQVLRALVYNNIDAITGERVARAANEGDALARAVIDHAAHALGWGIGTAITLINPERVVVGGGVSKTGEWYFEGVRAAARSNTLPQMRVDIVPAALGDDAPLWGAVALAEQLVKDHLSERAD
ncbi:MAG: ROK family protein [Acidobacteriota bacterium]